MKTVKKAVIYALIVTVVINGFSSLINILIYNLEKAIIDLLYIGPISFPLFFFPCFFSAIYYKKDLFKNLRTTIKRASKPALFSFVIIFVLVFFYMIVKKGFNVSYLSNTALPNGVFAVLISLFSMLVVFLLRKPNKARKAVSKIDVRPSITIAFIHFLWVSLAYFILLTFGMSSFAKFHVLFNFFITGLLVVLFVYFSFQYVFAKAKSNYWIIIIYAIGVFVIPFILSVLNSNISIEIFLIKIKVFLIVSTPYFLFLTLVIHTYFIYLINKQEKLNLMQKGVEASLKYQQLKAQLSPHFLFNNISVLTGLIEENQEKAVTFSQDLSKVYRYFLDHETQDLVLLKEELTFANKYLELLKVRFENALLFNNEITETKNVYILPMVLQQVFENIIKHNEISEEKRVIITMAIEAQFLVISNTLNPKMSTTTTTATGIENITNRYVFFTEDKVVVIKTESLYTIKLPLIKAEQ